MSRIGSAIQAEIDRAQRSERRRAAHRELARRMRFAWAEGIDTLFKFKSLIGESRAHVEDMILNSRIYFSDPSQFNDPLDCLPVCNLAKDLSDPTFVREMQADEDRMVAAEGIAPEQVAELRKAHGVGIQEVAAAVTENMRQELRREARLFCLAATQKNSLMWSHYAGSHTGVCLHFQCPEANGSVTGLARRVEYTPERHPIVIPLKYNKSDDEIVLRMVLTKSIDWQYEAEYRILATPRSDWGHTLNGRFCSFSPELLKGVTLGMNMSAADRTSIVALARAHTPPMAVFEAKENMGSFDMEIVAVGP